MLLRKGAPPAAQGSAAIHHRLLGDFANRQLSGGGRSRPEDGGDAASPVHGMGDAGAFDGLPDGHQLCRRRPAWPTWGPGAHDAGFLLFTPKIRGLSKCQAASVYGER